MTIAELVDRVDDAITAVEHIADYLKRIADRLDEIHQSVTWELPF